jgi:hypothetical protein
MSQKHKLHIIPLAVIIVLLLPQLLYSQIVSLPYGVIVKMDTAHIDGSSLNITLRVYSADSFFNGNVYVLAVTDSGAAPDSISLWTGNSDSIPFYRFFNYNMQLMVGKKAYFKAVFQCQFRQGGRLEAVTEEYFLWRLPDVVLIHRSSYNGLVDEELNYELKKSGCFGLPMDSLQHRNRDLYKKVRNHQMGLPHGHK